MEKRSGINRHRRKPLTGRGYRPEAEIVAARLGNEAGLIGAADLAREAVRVGEGAIVREDGPGAGA